MQTTLTCKNCGNNYTDNFCNHCGEKRYEEKDKSVPHLLLEGLHFITHLEGTFFNTIITLFKRPGKFSLDYCNGIRKKYFKPLSLFLLLVILYLLFPIFNGLNIKPHEHVTHSLYGEYAMRKAIKVMEEKQMTDAQFGEAFRHASEKTSKFLLFLIIPVMALFSWMTSFKKRKYFYDNFVFSIEATSLFILWTFLIFPLLFRIFNYFLPVRDEGGQYIFFINLSFFLIYLIIAAKRFFGFKWWYSIAYSLLYMFVLAIFIQFVYNFILFFITICII